MLHPAHPLRLMIQKIRHQNTSSQLDLEWDRLVVHMFVNRYLSESILRHKDEDFVEAEGKLQEHMHKEFQMLAIDDNRKDASQYRRCKFAVAPLLVV